MSQVQQQIFTKDECLRILPHIPDNIELQSTDTYNEGMLSETIKNLDSKLCCAMALQLAIVGFGQKTYGKVKYNNKEIDIKDFFAKNKPLTRFDATFTEKIGPEILTPRRLIRFFRYHIQEYLIVNKNMSSYLYRKFCPIHDEQSRTNIFAGSEHIVDNPDMIKLLYQTYVELDKRQPKKTTIAQRIERVYFARGIDETKFRNSENNNNN
jgi:hypothetical protein